MLFLFLLALCHCLTSEPKTTFSSHYFIRTCSNNIVQGYGYNVSMDYNWLFPVSTSATVVGGDFSLKRVAIAGMLGWTQTTPICDTFGLEVRTEQITDYSITLTLFYRIFNPNVTLLDLRLSSIVIIRPSFIYFDNSNIIRSTILDNSAYNISVGEGPRYHVETVSTETWRIDPGHDYKIVSFIRAFHFNTSKSTIFDLDLEVTILDKKQYVLNFSCTGKTRAQLAAAVTIVFDVSQANELNPINIRTGIFTIQNNQPYTVPTELYPEAKFVGFCSFNGFTADRHRALFYDYDSKSTSATYMRMRIVYFVAGVAFCENPTPFFHMKDNLCVDKCPEPYKPYFKTGTCIKCHISCKTCYGPLPQNCTTCPDSRTLIDGRCVCSKGMGVATDGQCVKCDITCQDCFSRPDYCLGCRPGSNRKFIRNRCECVPGFYEDGQWFCKPCFVKFVGCTECNRTACFSCNQLKSFKYDNYTCKCQQNFIYIKQCTNCRKVIAGCINCTNSTYCSQCQQQFININGSCRCHNSSQYIDIVQDQAVCSACRKSCRECLSYQTCISCSEHYEMPSDCKPTCGDMIILEDECEDGNRESGDGCSSQCQQQDNFICRVRNGKSQCSPKGQLLITVQDMQKDPFRNAIIIKIKVNQSKIFESFNWQQIISCSKTSISSDGMYLTVEYNHTIQHTILRCSVQPPETAHTFAIQPSGFNMYVDPGNLPANHYSQQTYLQARISKWLYISLCAVSLLVTLLSSWKQQLIGIQLLWLFQSRLLTVDPHPVRSMISFSRQLLHGCTLNLLELSHIVPPTTFKSVHFLHNVNIILVSQAAMLSLSVILWVILKYHPLKSKHKLYLHAIYCKVRAGCWILTLYHIPTMVYYAAICLRYMRVMVVVDIVRNVVGIVVGALLLGAMRMLPMVVIKGSKIEECTYKHHSMARLRLTMMVMERCFGPVICGLLPFGHAMLSISLTSTILIIILRPYCSKLRNVQSTLCLMAIVVCEIVTIIDSPGILTDILTWFQLSLMLLCCFVSLLTIYFLYK